MNGSNHRIPIKPLGLALSLFFVVSYTLCILYGLFAPMSGLHHGLFELMPGFTWINWSSFFVGLAWSIAGAWYIALVFTPIYNHFSGKSR